MAQGRQPRVAHEYVEACGKYGKYTDLDREADVVGGHKKGEKQRDKGTEERREEPGL